LTKKRGSFECEGWRVRKGGTVFWANIIFTAIYDSRKRLTGYAKVTKNITENQKTKKNLIRLVHEKN
jgi:PAS domain S-box-containing protein